MTLKAVAGGTGGSGSGGITISTTTITGGTNTRVLFDDNGVVGESAGLTFTKGNAGTTSLLFIGGAAVNLNSPSAGTLNLGTTAANALGSLNLTNLTTTGIIQTKLGTSSSTAINYGTANYGLYWDVAGSLVFTNAGVDGYYFGTANSRFTVANNAQIGWSSSSSAGIGQDTILSRAAAATLQLGAADVASGAVAQTLQVQSNTGTTTTGPDFIIQGSTGTSIGGNLIFKTAASTSRAAALTLAPGGAAVFAGSITAGANAILSNAVYMKSGNLSGFYWSAALGGSPSLAQFTYVSPGLLSIDTSAAGNGLGSLQLTNITATGAAIILSGLATDAAATDTTLCSKSSDGTVLKGSGTLGICLGTSGRQFKTDFAPMTAGLSELMQLPLYNYHYLPGHGDGGKRQQYGLTAQDVEKVMPTLAGHDSNGQTINYDYGALLFVSIKAIQELEGKVRDVPVLLEAIRDQQIMIDELQNRLDVH